MNNKEVIEKIQIAKNSAELSSFLEEVFAKSMEDKEVIISLLSEDIKKTIESYSSEKNFGFTLSQLRINGESYKLSSVINNLRYSIQKLKLINKQKKEEKVKLVFSEPDLPEFLADEQLMELFNYSKATISTKRSRGELPQKNELGLTAKVDLFKMLRETTPGYQSAEEKVQQRINHRRRR